MSATDLHTESGLVPNNAPTDPIVESAVVETTVAAPSVLGYSPDDFVDDDSWAKPRPRANKRLVWLAGAMGEAAAPTGARISQCRTPRLCVLSCTSPVRVSTITIPAR